MDGGITTPRLGLAIGPPLAGSGRMASRDASRAQRLAAEDGRTRWSQEAIVKALTPLEETTMAKLTEKKRDSLKESTFGLPDERKYPMPDKAHARNAKARAAQQVEQGNLTRAEEAKIDRKADRILGKN
jgi:hypothetical protein